jgi:glutamate synthase domain-containing protein 1
MCGIVGLFLKDKALQPRLGALLADMLVTMTDRGPDSAGIAIYGGTEAGRAKLTVQSANPATDFASLESVLEDAGVAATVTVKSTHAVVVVASEKLESARAARLAARPAVRGRSGGESVVICRAGGVP